MNQLESDSAVEFLNNNLTARYCSKTRSDYALLFSSDPIANQFVGYYEISIKPYIKDVPGSSYAAVSTRDIPVVILGISTKANCPLEVGIRNNGKMVTSDQSVEFCDPFLESTDSNQVVGCGVDYLSNKFIFTINGKLVKNARLENDSLDMPALHHHTLYAYIKVIKFYKR